MTELEEELTFSKNSYNHKDYLPTFFFFFEGGNESAIIYMRGSWITLVKKKKKAAALLLLFRSLNVERKCMDA